eukprot:1486991-Lingulodinium_polyedra.AAC.1
MKLMSLRPLSLSWALSHGPTTMPCSATILAFASMATTSMAPLAATRSFSRASRSEPQNSSFAA